MECHAAPCSKHHEWGLTDTLNFPWWGRPCLLGFRDELLPVGCEVLHGGSLGVPDGMRASLLWVSWLSSLEQPTSRLFQEAELSSCNCCWVPGMQNLTSVLK